MYYPFFPFQRRPQGGLFAVLAIRKKLVHQVGIPGICPATVTHIVISVNEGIRDFAIHQTECPCRYFPFTRRIMIRDVALLEYEVISPAWSAIHEV